MSKSERVMAAMAAFASARTAGEYRAAKRAVGRLGVIEQMAMVDTTMAARKRLLAEGVAL